MTFKNWPYWLKGGLLIFFLYIFYFLASLLVLFLSNDYILVTYSDAFLKAWNLSLLFPAIFFGKCYLRCPGCGFIYCGIGSATLAVNFVFYFLIGSILGLIYGKIKHRK